MKMMIFICTIQLVNVLALTLNYTLNNFNLLSNQTVVESVISGDGNYLLSNTMKGDYLFQFNNSFIQKGDYYPNVKQNHQTGLISIANNGSKLQSVIASSTQNNTIVIFNLQDFPIFNISNLDNDYIFTRLSKDGDYLLFNDVRSLSYSGLVKKRNVNQYTNQYRLDLQSSAIQYFLAISPNNNYIIACSKQNTILFRRNTSFTNQFDRIQYIGVPGTYCDVNDHVAALVNDTLLKIFYLDTQIIQDQRIYQSTVISSVKISNIGYINTVDTTGKVRIYTSTNITNYILYQTLQEISFYGTFLCIIDVTNDNGIIVVTAFGKIYIYTQCDNQLNCIQCVGKNICKKCKSGYQKFPSNADGCCKTDETFSATAKNCVNCPSTLNCLRCDLSNVCSLCKDNYNFTPNTNKCCPIDQTFSNISNSCVSCPSTLNCLRCDLSNVCSLCKDNNNFTQNTNRCCPIDQTFSNISNSCVSCPSTLNCLRCDLSNVCSLCKDNYNFTPNTNKCCPIDQTFSNISNSCVSCPSTLNCLRCDLSNVCSLCKDNYNFTPNTNKCCPIDQTFSNISNSCVSCPSTLNCLRCDLSNVCSLCKDNNNFTQNTNRCCPIDQTFSNISNSCVSCPSTLNCLRCNFNNQCQQCFLNYFLNTPSSIGCCPSHYYFSLSSNQCLYCLPMCQSCQSNATCLKCLKGYQFESSTSVCIQIQQSQPNKNIIIILSVVIPFFFITLLVVIIYCYFKKQSGSLNNKSVSPTQENKQQPIYSSTQIFRYSSSQKKAQQISRLNKLRCPVCKEAGVTHQAQCRHIYHNICIQQWIKRNHCCPQCAMPMNSNKTKQILPNVQVIRFV